MLCDVGESISHGHSQQNLENVQFIQIVIPNFYRELGPIHFASAIAADKADFC